MGWRVASVLSLLCSCAIDPEAGIERDCDRFDPMTNVWSALAPLPTWRAGYTATTLADARVLVVGGASDDAIVLVYDPVANAWLPGPSARRRDGHTATPIGAGDEVIVVGDATDVSVPPERISATAARTTATMATARIGHVAVALPGGDAWIAGGFADAPLASSEIYRAGADRWDAGPMLFAAHDRAAATILGDGRILVMGGTPCGTCAELVDLTASTVARAASMAAERTNPTATLLADGRVLVVGGAALHDPGAELYDPGADAWTVVGDEAQNRERHAAIRLVDGRVLVTGGLIDGGVATTTPTSALFDPATLSWSPLEGLAWRDDHAMAPLPDGTVAAFGGDAGRIDAASE